MGCHLLLQRSVQISVLFSLLHTCTTEWGSLVLCSISSCPDFPKEAHRKELLSGVPNFPKLLCWPSHSILEFINISSALFLPVFLIFISFFFASVEIFCELNLASEGFVTLEFMSFVCFSISDLWWVWEKSRFLTLSESLLHFYILRKSRTLFTF